MSENIPNSPAGATPPKPAEAAKVQPKKETVRINLPPKPTASPTIKIPTPAAVSSASPAPAAAAAAPVAAPVGAIAPQANRPAVSPAVSRPQPSRPTAPAVAGVDKVLGIVAFVVVVAVLGRLLTLFPSS